MILHYGVEVDTPANRPPDFDEIKAMPHNIQQWTLVALTRWVRDNGGQLNELLKDVDSAFDRTIVRAAWFSGSDRPENRDVIGHAHVVAGLGGI